MSKIVEGAEAPDFEMETADGPVRLADFAGRKLVLYFYPKDDTPGCTTEALDFSTLAGEFAATGASVLGVSKDNVKKHTSFAVKHGLTVRLAADPEGAVIERYESWVEKSLYGRQYMGIDRATFLIQDGVIRRIWRKVKVKGHAAEVLAAAKAP
ncbi:peroxiredoxin [Phenylobacterium sp.]|jgi:peroxiredoxin Q/BCP|uniref:peroxiredoxin n=1 Tax=Phenylobacterium sp. TaxID=1871053 RepID=UPI003784B24A